MGSILKGISGVMVYIDDILVTTVTVEEHLASLDEALKRLTEAGLRLRRDKCKFVAPSVEYLGYLIDAEGLHLTQEKIRAIQEAPKPNNVAELKPYFGLLARHWAWDQNEEFQKSKELLLLSQVLVHFDPKLNLSGL